MSELEKIFTGIGFGNPSFVGTEIEISDGSEYRQSGFVRMQVEGVYFRFGWGLE